MWSNDRFSSIRTTRCSILGPDVCKLGVVTRLPRMATILLLLVLQTQVTGSKVPASISGRVRDAAGKPLAGAVVSVGGFSRVRADSLGHYRMDLNAVGTLRVTAWAYGYQVTYQDAVVTPGKETELDFSLDTLRTGVIPAGSVFGVVRNADGHPLASAMVLVTETAGQALTDSLGRYHMDSL